MQAQKKHKKLGILVHPLAKEKNTMSIATQEPVGQVESAETADRGYTPEKEAYLHRLKRIEGQVRGIARMVEEDKYCIDILTQVAAVNKALHAVSIGLLDDHIGHCVVDAARESRTTADPDIVREKVREASDAIGRLLR